MTESEAYSAKAARAGKDIGKKGKNFEKIAKKAAERYGSEERGKKVAGAILKKLRMKEEVEQVVERFSDAQIAALRTTYSKISSIDPDSNSYKQLLSKLDSMDKATLTKVANGNIKFMSGLARNRLNRMKNEDTSMSIKFTEFRSRLDEATDVTDYNSKSQGGTRKELLAKYAKTKDPKHAESARKAGASQGELKAARMEEAEYINMGGARVKNDEKSVLKHVQKTFPNVKKVKKDPQHGWSPVFKEEVELEENYRVLATKGIGAERKEDIKVGHGVDYYHPKDGSKHMGKIHSMNDKGYVVRDDKTGEKHKFQYYRRMEEEVEITEINVNKIKKDLDSGLSHDAVIGKHANKKLSNTDEIRKVIKQHAWDKRMKKEEVESVEEMNKSGYSPGWMLKADPKLGKKVKDKITLAKLRQKAYGDPSAGKSVMTKENAEQVDEKAPPGKKYERMVKHIKKGYEGGGLTKQEKGIAYATAWKSYNKGK